MVKTEKKPEPKHDEKPKEVKKTETKKEEKTEHKKTKKKKSRLWLYLLAIVVIALLVYNWDDIVAEEVAAKVNGEPITVKQLETQYAALPVVYQQVMTKTDLLDRMIGFEVMRQNAEAAGYSVSDEEVNKVIKFVRGPTTLDEFKEQVLTQYPSYKKFTQELKDTMMIQKHISDNIEYFAITEEEMEEAYAQFASLEGGEQVEASHILICYEDAMRCTANYTKEEALAKAEEVLAELETMDFAEAAKQYSTGPSSVNGGELGWFSRGQMVGAFEDAAFSLEENNISEIVETEFGYHIIKVTGKMDSDVLEYEEMKPYIAFSLFNQKQQLNNEEFLGFAEKSKSEADVQISFVEEDVEISSVEELQEMLEETISGEETGDFGACFREAGVEEDLIFYYTEGSEKSLVVKEFVDDNGGIYVIERTGEVDILENCIDDFKKVIVPQLICLENGEFGYGEFTEEEFNSFVGNC